jgi:hypothetical protein
MNSDKFSKRIPELSKEKLKMEALCFFSNESTTFGKLYLTEKRIVLYRFDGTYQKIFLNEIQDISSSLGINLKLSNSKVCKIFSLNPFLVKQIRKTKDEMKASSWWGMYA